jgi:uncharacterized protein (TIGR02145 family)
MKKITLILSQGFIAILGLFLILSSCKKESETPPGNDNDQNEIIYCEEAFPNTNGEEVTIKFDGEDIVCELINGLYVYQGDIIISPDSIKGVGLKDINSRWTDKTVYYVINDNCPNPDRVAAAIDHWDAYTCLTFIERQDESNYIEFVLSSGCSSIMGMYGGRQEISVADWGTKGNIIHEIGHAIGLGHEHNKTNRDAAVTINWDNIKDGKSKWFNLYNNMGCTAQFDFGSIMLYSSNAFSKNGNPTIVKKDGSTYTAQRDDGLSDDDIEIVDLMYNACGGHVSLIHGGQTYKIVEIGDQCWMAENLKTTTYQNGTPIPNVTGNNAWQQLATGAYAWYDNDTSWKGSYGALYNYYATVNANGLCPTGWHVPTNDEWTALTYFIGGTGSPHGNELTSCRQVNSPQGGGCNTSEHPRWNASYENGTDNYGFSGLPGGTRSGSDYYSGIFGFIGEVGYWWSSSDNSSGYAWGRGLGYGDYGGTVSVGDHSKPSGLSVRCLKD